MSHMSHCCCGYTIRDACTIRSAHALNYVVENVTVSLHYWYHACDETLDGQTAQLAAYFCRLHCVFHLTVHVGSILIFLNVAYAMHYDVFTWMPIQIIKELLHDDFGYMWNKVWIFLSLQTFSFLHTPLCDCCMALGLLNLPCFDLRSLVLSKTVRVIFFIKSC